MLVKMMSEEKLLELKHAFKLLEYYIYGKFNTEEVALLENLKKKLKEYLNVKENF